MSRMFGGPLPEPPAARREAKLRATVYDAMTTHSVTRVNAATLDDIARWAGVSRTQTRAALIALTAKGLVVKHHRPTPASHLWWLSDPEDSP